MTKRYNSQKVAFLTQHGKEQFVAPLLDPFLDCQIVQVAGYDTDQLGTFSGEIKRIENQIETARNKARIGMRLANLPFGMASEGAFVADPFGGLMSWNIEVVLWIDDEDQFEVIGIAQGPARSLHRPLRKIADLENFAQEAGFPAHHLILRPQSDQDTRMVKGIANWDQLRKAFIDCHALSANGLVYAENDHRAFCSPTRQDMIVQATHDLMKKFESTCPACALPGFAVTGQKSGLMCRACGNTTKAPMSYIMKCNACHHSEEKNQPNNGQTQASVIFATLEPHVRRSAMFI